MTERDLEWFDEYEHDAIQVEHSGLDWLAVVAAYEREACDAEEA